LKGGGTDVDESVDSVHENIGVKKGLKQDLPVKEKKLIWTSQLVLCMKMWVEGKI
jgi:hypothetical protein